MTSTGQPAARISPAATLASTAAAGHDRPCDVMTMASAPIADAYAAIPATGSTAGITSAETGRERIVRTAVRTRYSSTLAASSASR